MCDEVHKKSVLLFRYYFKNETDVMQYVNDTLALEVTGFICTVQISKKKKKKRNTEF